MELKNVKEYFASNLDAHLLYIMERVKYIKFYRALDNKVCI